MWGSSGSDLASTQGEERDRRMRAGRKTLSLALCSQATSLDDDEGVWSLPLTASGLIPWSLLLNIHGDSQGSA